MLAALGRFGLDTGQARWGNGRAAMNNCITLAFRSVGGASRNPHVDLLEHPMRRSLAVSALAASIVGLGASPAWAHGSDDSGDGPPQGVGEFVPLPPEFYEPFTFGACGDEITIMGGDVRKGATRETTLEDGRTLIEYRGPDTADLVRESDGATIDELDVGGRGRTLISEDGTRIVDKLWGGSIAFPASEEERQEMLDLLGTDLAYWADPDEFVKFTVVTDPETGEALETVDVDIEAEIVDLCKVFDKIAAKDKDDDHDGDKDDDRHRMKHDDDEKGEHHHDKKGGHHDD